MTKSAPWITLSMDWISETSTSRNVVFDCNPGYLATVSWYDALFLDAKIIFEDDSDRAFWIAFAELEPTRPVPPIITIVLSPSCKEDTTLVDFVDDLSCPLLIPRKTYRSQWYLCKDDDEKVVAATLILCNGVSAWYSGLALLWIMWRFSGRNKTKLSKFHLMHNLIPTSNLWVLK